MEDVIFEKLISESEVYLDYMEARIGMLNLEPEHEIALYVLIVRSILGAIFQGKPEKTIRELVDVIASGAVEEARLLQIIDYEMRENGE